MDDYKDEIIERLKKSLLYQNLKDKCEEKDAEVIGLVENVASYSCSRSKTIIKHMGEFTLHDSEHLFRVLHLMERLLSPNVIENLSIPELQLLLLTAMMHDIGMAPEEREVLAWKKVFDFEPDFESEIEKKSYDDFKRFYSARPNDEDAISNDIIQGKHSKADILKNYLITEFIRSTHAERARDIIEKDWDGKIVFRDVDLTVEFAQLCFSHNEDALSLLDLDKSLLCISGIVACLPLVGLILRLADIVDFDGKRTPPVLFSHLYVRHPVSLIEWNKHRAVESWEIGPDIIQFAAKCSHPAIEASIHEFCNFIDKELSICNNIITSLNAFNTNKNYYFVMSIFSHFLTAVANSSG